MKRHRMNNPVSKRNRIAKGRLNAWTYKGKRRTQK